jgi:hypothetical protein
MKNTCFRLPALALGIEAGSFASASISLLPELYAELFTQTPDPLFVIASDCRSLSTTALVKP